MTNQETIFIGAEDGGIAVYKGVANKVGFARNASALAYILDTHKIYGEVMFTSSMDFADEEGFAHYDGAKNLWNEAIEMRV